MATVGTIPLWMLGSGTGAVVLTVLSLNTTTGALDDGTPGNNDLATLTGLLDGLQIMPRKNTQNLSPLNRTNAHHYPITIGYDIVLSEIMGYGHLTVSTSYTKCFLGNAWFAGRSAYVRVVATRQGRSFSMLGIMTAYEETLVRGKNVARLTVQMIDSGTAPTLA
jgi:hypothetical protein